MKCNLIFILSIILVSCNSSRITSSWKEADTAPVNYKKILVIALSQPDNALKEQMEQHLVEDIQSHGMQAISAFKQYGPKAFEKMSEQTAIEKIQNSGADAILTIVLLDKSKERNYVHSNITYTPYALYYNRFWGYYTTLYGRVYSPGYYVTNTAYFLGK